MSSYVYLLSLFCSRKEKRGRESFSRSRPQKTPDPFIFLPFIFLPFIFLFIFLQEHSILLVEKLFFQCSFSADTALFHGYSFTFSVFYSQLPISSSVPSMPSGPSEKMSIESGLCSPGFL